VKKVARTFIALIYIVLSMAASAQTRSHRDPDPKVSDADLSALVTGNTIFAISSYKELGENSSVNMVFSPYSLSNALAMTWAGARGETATQIAKTLSFALPQSRFNQAFNRLDLTLNMPSTRDNATGQPMIISSSSLWLQARYQLRREFIETLAVHYGIEPTPVDFAAEPTNAIQTINRWVEERTVGRIAKLIDQLGKDTRLLVVNAVTFKGAWQNPFLAERTTTEEFYLLDQSPVSASFMVREGTFSYVIEDDLVAIELPYAGGDWSMIVIMPGGGFSRFLDLCLPDESPTLMEYERRLSINEINRIRHELDISSEQGETIELHFPHFEMESKHELVPVLSLMGMPLAFDRWKADFTGIATPPSPEDELYITQILQKALMKVTEEGTEAVAATAVIMGVRGGLPKKNPNALTIDRPFIVFIQHRPTGSILFMGKVLDPRRK
jgi:serpin B